MKELLLFLPLTIVYLALKSTLFAAFPLPDVPLLIVFFMACRKSSVDGAVAAFVLGYLDDAFSGSVIGSSSFALVVIFLTVHLTARFVQFSTPAAKAGGAAAAALVKGGLTYYVLRFANVDVYFITHVVLQALVTGIFAPAVMALLKRMAAIVAPHSFKDNES